MRTGPIVLLAWGALLLALTAVQLPFSPDLTTVALLGGAGLACVAAGLGLWLAGRREPAEWRSVPALSPAGALLGCGIALAVVGAELGHWLQLIGAGVVALGLAGLVRERRA